MLLRRFMDPEGRIITIEILCGGDGLPDRDSLLASLSALSSGGGQGYQAD
jgi:hypothetical protein